MVLLNDFSTEAVYPIYAQSFLSNKRLTEVLFFSKRSDEERGDIRLFPLEKFKQEPYELPARR